nr:helix-turn-helix transcriptional regulator [uncultured Acetatifactor sp.]
MEMAERIKERRKAMGYTQTELGEKLGLQASAIAKYENGRVENIKRSTIADMAEVLGCSPSYLMGWSDSAEDIKGKDDPLTLDEMPTSEQLELMRFSRIKTYYEMLNDIGKHVAAERVKELTEVPRYVQEE